MELNESLEPLARRLRDLGFSLVRELSGGPMGSALWRFSSNSADLEVQKDRGRLVVGMGKRAGAIYGFIPWARLLNVPVSDSLDFMDQFEFFVKHMDRIGRLLDSASDVEDRLQEINWELVKDYLHLDPDMPIPPGERPDGEE